MAENDHLYPEAVVVKVQDQEIIAGQDGISPEVTVTEIGTVGAVSSHGHKVSVIDRYGTHEYSVYDGASAYEQAVAGGYTGTEAQFNAELAAFKDLSEQAASSATAAASSATAAAGSATAAAGSATDAAGSATQAASSETAAAGSASNAASSATSASGSAAAAASSATAAAGSASDAATAKTAAEAAQTAAAASAASASDSADSAASSATAASGSATVAANSATAAAASAAAIEEYEHDAEAWAVGKRGGTDVESTDSTYHNNSKYYAAQAAADASTASSAASAASQSEQNAAASATSASQSETNAAASETAAAGSASTATTAATAASNSATAAANSATAAGDAKTAAETAQGKAEDAQEAAEQAQSDAEDAARSVSQSAAQIETNRQDISDLKSTVNDPATGLNNKANAIIGTASGTIASFDDGADGLPLKKLVVNIGPVQAGSGDPSPQNVRAISGWTGASIYREAVYDSSANPIVEIPFPTPPGTVYGGTLTINDDGTGELVVQKVKLVLTGSENWAMAQSDVFFIDSDIPSSYTLNAGGDWLCNKYLVVAGVKNTTAMHNDKPEDSITNQPGSSTSRHYDRILVKDSTYSTVEDFKASLSTTNLEIIYSLPTPYSYSLTAAQITTLLGTNNVWADCGDVSVEYRADTKLYIQKINAPTDNDMTADARIESGKYFIVGNNLYLSTTTIPAGDTIIPGTNCTQTNLAAALNALNT